jgi:hypothetical protein
MLRSRAAILWPALLVSVLGCPLQRPAGGPPEAALCRSPVDVAALASDSLTRVYADSEVTQPVVQVGYGRRVPPPDSALLRLGLPQHAMLSFIVDTRGRVEPCSITLLETTHPLWGTAVLRYAPDLRFRPARRGVRRVRQFVSTPFVLTLR